MAMWYVNESVEDHYIWLNPDRDWERYFAMSWPGPIGDEKQEGHIELKAKVRKVFASYNVIGECVTRWLSGVLGREPAIQGASEQIEAITSLRKLWRRKSIHSEGLAPILEAFYYWYGGGLAYLRLYQVPGSNQPIVHRVEPGQIEVDYNGLGDIAQIIYRWSELPTNDEGEIQRNQQPIKYRELQRVLPSGLTLFQYYEGEGDVPTNEFTLDLGGAYTVLVMKRTPAVTTAIKSLQRMLNGEITILGQNSSYGGFLRELWLNSQPPGSWEQVGNRMEFIPSNEPITIGSGRATVLTGLPKYDAQGNVTGYETPSVVHKDPVPSTSFLEAIEGYRSMILSSFGQQHVLNSDKVASEESRIQARNDWRDLLELDCSEIELYLEYLYSVALRLTGVRSPGIEVTCIPDAGAPSSAEKRETREDYKAGLIDQRTALTALGYNDPDEIMAALAEDEPEPLRIDPSDPDNLPPGND